MEPRSNERGNRGLLRPIDGKSEASMEPRSNERGNRGRLGADRALFGGFNGATLDPIQKFQPADFIALRHGPAGAFNQLFRLFLRSQKFS